MSLELSLDQLVDYCCNQWEWFVQQHIITHLSTQQQIALSVVLENPFEYPFETPHPLVRSENVPVLTQPATLEQ